MTTTQILAELNRLPIARNSAVAATRPRMANVAASLAASGIAIRKGGSSRSASHSISYIYATAPGGREVKVWEEITTSCGYLKPLSGRKITELLHVLETLTICELV